MAIEHEAVVDANFTSWASEKTLCMKSMQFAKGHTMVS